MKKWAQTLEVAQHFLKAPMKTLPTSQPSPTEQVLPSTWRVRTQVASRAASARKLFSMSLTGHRKEVRLSLYRTLPEVQDEGLRRKYGDEVGREGENL